MRYFAFYMILAIALLSMGYLANNVKTTEGNIISKGWLVGLEFPVQEKQSSSQSTLTATGEFATVSSCVADCGDPCWLVTSGSPPGTFDLSNGNLGLRDCTGICWNIKEYKEDCG
jgi:hypothetical protein